MRTGIVLSTTLAAILCLFQAAPAADTNSVTAAKPGNQLVARGIGLEITRGDVDDAMTGIRSAYEKQGQSLSPAQVINLEKQVLNNLIVTKLLLAKATDADKEAGKKAANLQITALKENAGSQEAVDQRLKSLGMTEAGLSAKLTQDATAQAVLQRELQVTVTDDEAKNYYDTHGADFEQPEMVRISHILIFTVDPVTHAALSAAQLDARRKLGDNIVKAARAGADFSRLAKQYSEDPGSKAGGGELPPFPRGQMAPEIDTVAFSLTNNQVSDVITTSIGYQIVKLVDKTPAKKTDYLTAIASIKQALTQQKSEQLGSVYLDGLKKAAAVEILDLNLKSAAANGGNLPAASPVAASKP